MELTTPRTESFTAMIATMMEGYHDEGSASELLIRRGASYASIFSQIQSAKGGKV